jgi:hypothetical protein
VITTLLSLGVLAGLVLIGFGVRGLIVRDIDRLKAGLMVGAGVAVLINVWLYALPPLPPH